MVLVVEICDHEVRNAVSIHVTGIHAHAGFGNTAGIVRHLSIEPHILKSAVLLVNEKQIWGSVTGHEKIRPTIVIHVDCNHSERSSDEFVESRTCAHVSE